MFWRVIFVVLFNSQIILGSDQASAGSAYTLPIPKEDKRPQSLSNSIPLNLNERTITVVGEYAGHKYYDGAVPLWKKNGDGELVEVQETVPIGSSVKVLAFVRFRRTNYFRLESQGKTSDYRFIDGRFLALLFDSGASK